jgi:hypothetical protein
MACGHNNIYMNGECRDCDREKQARYRRRRRLGMALLHAAEARGLSGGEAIALIQNADYWNLQACQSASRQAGLVSQNA